MRFLLAFAIFNVGLQIFGLILNVIYLSWGALIKKTHNIDLNNYSHLDIRSGYLEMLRRIAVDTMSEEYKNLTEFIETAQICVDIGELGQYSKFKLFLESIEAYNDLIEYASMAMIPLQLVGLFSVKFCCNECERCTHEKEDEEEFQKNIHKMNMNKAEIEL